jgi:hypothetical protein
MEGADRQVDCRPRIGVGRADGGKAPVKPWSPLTWFMTDDHRPRNQQPGRNQDRAVRLCTFEEGRTFLSQRQADLPADHNQSTGTDDPEKSASRQFAHDYVKYSAGKT